MPKKKKTRLKLSRKKLSFPQLLGFLLILIIATLFTAYEESSHPTPIPEDGEPLAIYTSDTRHDLKKLYLKTIEGAQKSIDLYIYSLTDAQVIKALKDKALEGIAVTVITDKETGQKPKAFLGKSIQVISRQNEGLMHLKILIIDKKQVLIGSANMTNESLSMHHNNVCVLQSENFAHHLLHLTEELQRPNNLTGNTTVEQSFRIGGQYIEMWVLAGNPRASKRLIQLIDSAQKSVRVAMFTFTRYDLAYALMRAQKRGVKVEVAMDRNSALGASQHVANLLYFQNIPLKVNHGSPLLHHKSMLIDDEIFVTGSANWTKRAFNENDDCFLVIHGLFPEQAQTLQAFWNTLFNGCDRYTCNEELEAA